MEDPSYLDVWLSASPGVARLALSVGVTADKVWICGALTEGVAEDSCGVFDPVLLDEGVKADLELFWEGEAEIMDGLEREVCNLEFAAGLNAVKDAEAGWPVWDIGISLAAGNWWTFEIR